MKMGRRDLWFLVMLGFFFANTMVIIFCHHVVTDQYGMAHTNTIGDGNTVIATSDMISFFLEANTDDDLPVFSICLLTRDDLPILPEWIAYHYHAVNLRHLVVAVDPTSRTDPQPIFDTFRKHLGTKDGGSKNNNNNNNNNNGLVIEQWNDADFMPEYFLNGEYGKAPNFIGGSQGNPDDMTWEGWYSTVKGFGYNKKKDMTLVNSHRYRQTRFLARCSEHLKHTYQNNQTATTTNAKTKTTTTTNSVWMSTLDSDEYLAVNPWMMQENPSVDKHILRLEQGSVLRWLVDSKAKQLKHQQHHATTTTTKTRAITNEDRNVCLQVPRLLFGAVELSPNTTTPSKLAADRTHGFTKDNETVQFVGTIPRHANKMETLRWKFHAASDDERNFQQKVILDLSNVPEDDEIWGDHVHTVHRPSRKLCAPESDNNMNGTLLVPTPSLNTNSNTNTNINTRAASPVVAFHYIGSKERYFSRPNDSRRNNNKYRVRSNITHSRDETGWIDQWLERFVEDVGIETASALLSTYVVES